jgi:dihydroflavonol-4-reductase
MIFVTGSTGLLGTHVLAELTKRGHSIRALRRKNSDISNVEKVFAFYFGPEADSLLKKITWVEGDITDVVSLEKGMKGCDVVYHCAALVSFKRRDFKKLIKLNKEGTANVVNVCLSLNINHLCYVSSTAAVGRSSIKTMYDETNKWITDPDNSGYAISKYSAENEVWRGIEEGLNAVIVNPCVILGPGNWNESSLSIFKVIKKGLRFYTPGANAFVDARDVAFTLAELSERKIFNERFLVIGENLKYKTLFDKIAAAFNVKGPSMEAKPWMAALVWRIEGVLAFLFGKKQNITRETARSSMNTVMYSNEKIKTRIGMEFHSMDEVIQNAVNYFSQHKQ